MKSIARWCLQRRLATPMLRFFWLLSFPLRRRLEWFVVCSTTVLVWFKPLNLFCLLTFLFFALTAKASVQRRNQEQPMNPIQLLDVFPVTILRPDGHRSAPQKCIGCPTDDCLHYILKGPPDWWNHLLFSNLKTFVGKRAWSREFQAVARKTWIQIGCLMYRSAYRIDTDRKEESRCKMFRISCVTERVWLKKTISICIINYWFT